MERMQRRKRLKEFKRGWMKFFNAKFWEMAGGEEEGGGGDKSRIKSASAAEQARANQDFNISTCGQSIYPKMIKVLLKQD